VSTGKAFRAAVNTALQDWAIAPGAVPIFFENGPQPDLANVGDVWVDTEVRFYGASTAALGERPMGRATGALVVRVFVREGEGTGRADDLMDQLEELFRPRRLGGARFDFPERLTPTQHLGWHKVGILAPFSLDRA